MAEPSPGPPDTPASDLTSASLLERVRADDPEAWRRFVHLYSPLVYAWCRRSGLNADDTADVAQEVFRAVAGHIAGFRRDRPGDSFRGWLWTVTRNKLRDFFRRAAERPVAVGGSTMHGRIMEVPDEEPAPDDPSAADGPGGLLHRALELIRTDFEETSWKAFWLVAVERRPTADVAAELGLSVFAVYQAKYRVTRRLREELKDLVDFAL
jgi:RNA polymerase sigma-70 factor (ECF subfamily)